MTLLWGFPFLVRGETTLSDQQASLLLSLVVVAVIYGGPAHRLVHRPASLHRSTTVLTIVWSIVAVWTAVLAWPGDAPLWLLVLPTQVTGIGGPASMIGFDLALHLEPGRTAGQRQRDHQPGRLLRAAWSWWSRSG